MKKLTLLSALIIAHITACNKSNNYSITDHTTGMITVRQLTGIISGYAKGDTVFTGDTTHHEWPDAFNRLLIDTSVAIGKINGFAVSIMGYTLNYRSTDVANKTKRFDTLVAGTLDAVLIYYYDNDSMSFVSHQVSGFNSTANQYYQNNITLHTK
ncbi:MAG: hypothetical protein K0Q79_2870 [Flavipsychrobacter sp.]|jgi:hypothetical protein|nr:hypothetical protein [Flavipsychrobacter sp.]